MLQLLSYLTEAIEGAPALALAAAAAWGVLSILLSPCHLASIPLIVGFIGNQQELTRRRAFALASAFALGIFVTIAVVGGITAALGQLVGSVGRVGDYLAAVVFFVVGLLLMDVVPLPLSPAAPGKIKRRGLAAALVLGLVFGIALGPCTFAWLITVLTVSLQAAASNVLYAAGLLIAYGVGHCSVIVAAGTFTEAVQRYLHWSSDSRGAAVLKKVCGVLVMLGGVYYLLRPFL